jgi:hypothetical protein
MTGKLTMPIFVFQQRSDIERETGLILAGKLIVDIPKGKRLTRHQEELVAAIVQQLTARAQSGQIPD